jgi:phage shock protein PspC (stress-responsive transcriptional regulator)
MSEHITYAPTVKRLERSRDGRILAGVCAGLGRYFDITPAVFRLGLVVLTILGGAGVLVYLAAVLVIPKEGEERSIAEDVLVNRRDHPARLIALGLVAVAILSLLARADTWPTAGAAWFLIVVAGLVLLWTGTRRHGRGLLIAAVTLVALLFTTAVAAVVAAFGAFDVSLGDGIGNHSYVVTSTADVTSYHLGIGKLRLDLSQLPPGRSSTVTAHVGIGDVEVVLPRDENVLVRTHVKAGSIDALGHHDDGTGSRIVTGNPGGLVVDATVGAGHIEVTRAP